MFATFIRYVESPVEWVHHGVAAVASNHIPGRNTGTMNKTVPRLKNIMLVHECCHLKIIRVVFKNHYENAPFSHYCFIITRAKPEYFLKCHPLN